MDLGRNFRCQDLQESSSNIDLTPFPPHEEVV
jgi:hypothetical protein